MIIRRATSNDKNRIFEFIKTAFEDWDKRIPERWYWLFVDNPYVKKTNLPIWIAVDDNAKVIGQCCVMIEPLKIGNNILMTGWGIDYKVLTSHEGLGIAPLILIAKWKNSNSCIQMSLGMNQISRKMNMKMGSMPISKINSYILNFRSDALTNYIKTKNLHRLVKGILGLSFFSKITSSLVNKWLSLRRRIYTDFKGLNFIPINYFGQEIDLLWDKISKEFDCAIVRNSKYLNWKYLKQPHVKYDIFLIKIIEEVVGYIILRKNDNQGIIVDFLFSTKKNEFITESLSFAVDHFFRKGVYDIRVATSVKEYSECIKKIGIPRPSSSEIPVFFAEDPVNTNIAKTKKWLLSYGDCDQQQ